MATGGRPSNVRPRVRHAFHVQCLSEAFKPISGTHVINRHARLNIIMLILEALRTFPEYVIT